MTILVTFNNFSITYTTFYLFQLHFYAYQFYHNCFSPVHLTRFMPQKHFLKITKKLKQIHFSQLMFQNEPWTQNTVRKFCHSWTANCKTGRSSSPYDQPDILLCLEPLSRSPSLNLRDRIYQ